MPQPSPLEQAHAAYQAGDLAQAEQLCQQITQSHPNSPAAWYLLAMMAHREGNSRQSAERIKKAIEHAPENVEYLAHAAEILRKARQLDDALVVANKAVQLAPQHPATNNNLGLVLLDNDNLDRAEASFRQAIDVDQQYYRAHNNLGNVLIRKGQTSAAIEVFREALRIRSNNPQALNGMGLALKQRYCYDEALTTLNQALQIRPDYPQALLNLANLHAELGREDQAEQCLRKLLLQNPEYEQAWHDLAALLERRGKLHEACEAYRRAVAVDPASARSLAALENAKRRCCDWSDRPECIDRLLEIVRQHLARGAPSPLWPLASLRFPTTSSDRLAIATEYARLVAASVSDPLSSVSKPTTKSCLRIGFLSHEFGHTVVSHLMAGLYRRFDRQRFEILAFDYSKNDCSELRHRIASDCDQFIEIPRTDPAMAAKRIAAEQVHILMDVNSYMPGGCPEIAAHRPAPIQVSYMYPASMGADWIDYFFTDSFVTPPAHEQFFTEKLVYLPATYLPMNCDQPISQDFSSRAKHGLPEDGFVYCSFNNADKIEPDLFDVWMRILDKVPRSVLWQRSDSSIVQNNLREQASLRGIDPQRLVFAGQLPGTADHLARHRHADLFLDTLTHGGHGTAVDALWAGVPVLACPVDVFTSRVAASLLTVAGLTELIVENLDEYERLAIELAQQPDQLQSLRHKLAKARESNTLFNTARLVRSLEAAFEEMWRRHQLGQAPAAIDVDDLQRSSDS